MYCDIIRDKQLWKLFLLHTASINARLLKYIMAIIDGDKGHGLKI